MADSVVGSGHGEATFNERFNLTLFVGSQYRARGSVLVKECWLTNLSARRTRHPHSRPPASGIRSYRSSRSMRDSSLIHTADISVYACTPGVYACRTLSCNTGAAPGAKRSGGPTMYLSLKSQILACPPPGPGSSTRRQGISRPAARARRFCLVLPFEERDDEEPVEFDVSVSVSESVTTVTYGC